MRLADGRTALVANMHATSYRPDERLADAEILRAAVFADALAEPGDVCVLAGDLNVTASRSWTLTDLAGPEWGFSEAGPGIDQILVRGAEATRPRAWPPERRRVDDRVLSDHTPVELRFA
jgi:endonuclease/exonuclease/phosphatase family metal-dependent hydrolase